MRRSVVVGVLYVVGNKGMAVSPMCPFKGRAISNLSARGLIVIEKFNVTIIRSDSVGNMRNMRK